MTISYRWVSNGFETKAPPTSTSVENICNYKIFSYFQDSCLVLTGAVNDADLQNESRLRSREEVAAAFWKYWGRWQVIRMIHKSFRQFSGSKPNYLVHR